MAQQLSVSLAQRGTFLLAAKWISARVERSPLCSCKLKLAKHMFDPLNLLVRLLGQFRKSLNWDRSHKHRSILPRDRHFRGRFARIEQFEQRTVFDSSLSVTSAMGLFVEGAEVQVSTSETSSELEYKYSVLKEGQQFESGIGSNFRFTPDDNGSYNIAVTVLDGSQSLTIEKSIQVENVAPKGTFAGPRRVAQNATSIFGFSTYTDVSADAPLKFAISTDSQAVANATYQNSSSSPNYAFENSTLGTHTVYGKILDKDGGASPVVAWNIEVTNPTLPVGRIDLTTNQFTPISLKAADIPNTDPEGDAVVSITIASIQLAQGDSFTYDGQPLAGGTSIAVDKLHLLRFTPALGRFGDRSTLTIHTKDNAQGTTAGTIAFHVTSGTGDLAFSDAPTSISIPENNKFVFDVNAVDPQNRQIFYDIAGPDVNLFTINLSTGELRFFYNPDFESPMNHKDVNEYTVIVSAGTSQQLVSRTITVQVDEVNEAPEMPATSSATINENELYALNLRASDPDLGETLTYSISGGDSDKLNVDHVTGKVNFKAPPDYEHPVDSDKNNVYVFTATASDGELTATQLVSVSILNANDPPRIISGLENTVFENQTLAMPLAVQDDENDSLLFDIVKPNPFNPSAQPDGELFSFNKNGNLDFITPPDYEFPSDADHDNVYLVTVTVAGGQSTTVDLTITVGDVNEGPVGSTPVANSQQVDVNEDEVVLITLTADDGDPDADHSLTYVIANPLKGTLLAGRDGPVIRDFPYFLSGNQLYFQSATNDDSDQFFKFTVRDENQNLSAEATVSVNVVAVNDAPKVTLANTITSLEEGTQGHYVVADIDIFDVDGGTNSLSLTGVDNDADYFEIVDNKIQLRSDVTLDYETKRDFQITVNVNDESVGSGIYSSADFHLSVSDVNEQPVVVAALTNLELSEGAQPIKIGLSTVFHDLDASDVNLTYHASSSNLSLATVAIVNGELVLTLAERLNGSADISVEAIDQGGLKVTSSFRVNVVNSLPSVVLSQPTDGFLGVVGQTRSFLLSPMDHTDNAGEPFSMLVEWGDSTTTTYNSTGPLLVEHAYATSGSKSIKVTVTDPQKGVGVLCDNLMVLDSELQGSTLSISGTSGNDSVTISSSITGSLNFSLNSAPATAIASSIQRVQFFMGDGVDNVSFSGTAANDLLQVAGTSLYWALASTPTMGITVAAIDTESVQINALEGNDRIEILSELNSSTTLNVSGGTGSDTLRAANILSSNQWQISAAGAGSISFGSANSPSLNFTEIENIIGSDVVADDLQFATTGSLSGFVTGGEGTALDTLTLIGANKAFQIENRSATGLGSWSDFEILVATAGVLVGPNSSTQWNIDGSGSGDLNYNGEKVSFSGMNRLVGGTQKDTFVMLPGATMTEITDASYGGTQDVISYQQFGTAVQVGLSVIGSARGSSTGIARFSNIEKVVGSNLDDSIASPSIGNGAVTWNVNGPNAGSVGATGSMLDFASFENLYGGDRPDQFVLGPDGTALFLSGGNGTQLDSIQGPDVPNQWSIRSSGSGYLNAQRFSGFENILGGADADYVNMERTGVIPNLLNPGDGLNTLSYEFRPTSVSVNMAAVTPVATNVGSIVDKFSIIVGGSAGDSLIGGNNGALIFGGGGNDQITGGTGKDVLIGGVGADTLRGGGGEDIVIGGRVSFESIDVGRKALFSAWSASSSSYLDRINSLLRNEAAPQPYYLSNHPTAILDTLIDDGAIDSVWGQTDLDWLVAGNNDTVDLLIGERRDNP